LVWGSSTVAVMTVTVRDGPARATSVADAQTIPPAKSAAVGS
jgi:hypothetical protein